MDVIEILKEYGEYFKQMSVIWFVLYPLIWSLLVDGFYDIAIRMEGMLESVLSFGGVMQSDGMQTLYDYLTPLAFVFLTVAIIGIAYQLILGKTVQKTNVFLNVVLAVSVILLLPWMVLKLGELSDDFIDVSKSAGVDDNIEVSALSTQIVQMNTRDVVYLARNDFTEADNNINNTITDGNIRSIDFTEVVHPEPEDSGNRDYGEDGNGNSINKHEVFTSKIVDDNEGGETTTEIEPFELSIIGEIPMLNEYYYRYTGNFVTMFAQLGILIAVMLFTSLKVVRLFFEIAFANIIAPFVATTDLSTGQRTKQLLKDLVINFSVVGLVMLVFKLFMVMMNYLGTLDLNPIVFTIIMFALGLATIDGPDQAKKLLGIDIGVKDGYKQLMAGLAVGSVATKASSGVRRHMGNEKDKLMQQRQDNKEAKDSSSEKLSGIGSNSSAYSIDNDLNNAMNTDGYMNTGDRQGAVADKGETDGLSTNGQAGTQSTSESDAELTDTSRPQTLENLVQNADGDLDDKERNVLEKVMEDGSASLNSDERQTLNSLMSDDTLGSEEKQALVHTMDAGSNLSDSTAVESAGSSSSTDQQDVLENLVSNGSSNISDDEKQVLENLIQNPTSMSGDEKQVLENLVQTDSIGTQERQAIESLMSTGENTHTDQNRNVIENLISNGSGNISDDEKQVLENLIQNPTSMSGDEKQVLENLVQTDSIGTQERQAVETLMSSGDTANTQATRNVLENLTSTDTGALSQAERQVFDKFTDSPNSLTPADRSVIENVMSSGALNTESRQTVEQVLTNHPSSEPVSRQVVQTLSNEGSMTAPDIQQNVVRMMNESAIGSQEADAVINTLHSPTPATAEQREVVENVITNHPNLGIQDRQAIENVVTQSANIGSQERQVFEKVMQAPHDISQSERQVLENVVSNDNNLTAKERTAIENVVQNHVTNNEPQQSSSGSQVTQTEDIVRNMKTNFKTDGSRLNDVKQKHQEINNRWKD